MNAADTVLAALGGAVPVGTGVYDSIVPGVASAAYVVVSIPPGLRSLSGIDGVSDHVLLRFSTMSVASNTNPAYAAAECRWLQAKVQDALTDLVVVADGWGRSQIKHEGDQNPKPDEATPDKKVYATDQWSLETTRVS